MKPATNTVVRVALLAIALVNLILSSMGYVPVELIDNPGAYHFGSAIVTALLALITTWENNSFSQEAQEADRYLESLIAEKKRMAQSSSDFD